MPIRRKRFTTKNIAKAAAGANTAPVTFSGAAIYPDIQILEYSGLSLSDPLHVTAGAAGTSSTASSGSATTATANELIFGVGTTRGTFTWDRGRIHEQGDHVLRRHSGRQNRVEQGITKPRHL
jgi:hypothetical protein